MIKKSIIVLKIMILTLFLFSQINILNIRAEENNVHDITSNIEEHMKNIKYNIEGRIDSFRLEFLNEIVSTLDSTYKMDINKRINDLFLDINSAIIQDIENTRNEYNSGKYPNIEQVIFNLESKIHNIIENKIGNIRNFNQNIVNKVIEYINNQVIPYIKNNLIAIKEKIKNKIENIPNKINDKILNIKEKIENYKSNPIVTKINHSKIGEVFNNNTNLTNIPRNDNVIKSENVTNLAVESVRGAS